MRSLHHWWADVRLRRRFRGDGVFVARGSWVHPETTIGRGTRINLPSHLDDCEIGAFCAIGGRLVIRSRNHYTNRLNMQEWAQHHVIGSTVSVTGDRSGTVRIGNGVWIGDSVIVLPGVTVGDGAVIGAGSVVTRSVPAYTVVAGNPARVLRSRFPAAVVEVLAGVEWWTWNEDRLRSNRALFEIDLATVDPEELRRVVTGLA